MKRFLYAARRRPSRSSECVIRIPALTIGAFHTYAFEKWYPMRLPSDSLRVGWQLFSYASAIRIALHKAKRRCQTSAKPLCYRALRAHLRLSRPAPLTTRPSLQDRKPALAIVWCLGKVKAQNGVLVPLMGCFRVVLGGWDGFSYESSGWVSLIPEQTYGRSWVEKAETPCADA